MKPENIRNRQPHQGLFTLSLGLLTFALWLGFLPHAQATYQINTVAGSGIEGYSGDGETATLAKISHGHGIAVDRHGHLYIADTENKRIRKVDSKTGIITTVAGGGTVDISKNKIEKLEKNTKATEVQLGGPSSVAIDKAGNLFILDQVHYRVYKVDTKKVITLVAGKSGEPGDSGDGKRAIDAQISPYLGAISLDSKNNLFIADRANHCIRKVHSKNGHISEESHITAVAGKCFKQEDSDNGVEATKAKLNEPADVKVAPDGKLYIADSGNHVVLQVENGTATIIAGNGTAGYGGDGGKATQAKLNEPTGIALDRAGNLYIADFKNHRIRKVDNEGIITTIAGNGAAEFSGDGGTAKDASLNMPERLALDFKRTGAGLYVSDKFNVRIRQLNREGIDPKIWAVLFLLGLGILLGIALYYLRLYRHPIVQTLSADTKQLLTTPVEQLSQTKRLLKRTHRLDTILANNNVPPQWLDNAINFATMPNVERTALLANRLIARKQTTDKVELFELQFSDKFPLNVSKCRVYFPQANQAAQDVILQLQRDEMSSQITVVISLEPIQQIGLRPEGENRANQWVVPNSRELTTLLLSPKPIDVFAQLLTSQLKVINISPYQTGAGIEKDSVFFGRDDILALILNREPRNYLVVGGRQMGKSSLLKKIERRYKNHPQIKCFYLSLMGDNVRKFNVTFGLAKDAPLSALLDKLADVPTGERRLILIDEADFFLRHEIENSYPTLNKFRSVSDEGRCHFILAGFWDLYYAVALDYQSPIVNFGESIIVMGLEQEACRQLITKPMALLGIHYASKDLIEQIITATGQRANLVAIVCNEMVENLSSDRRELTAEDVTNALHSWAVEDTLTTWAHLSQNEPRDHLARLIVYATVKANEFSLNDVVEVLDKQGYVYTTEQLKQSLKCLELAYIIWRDKQDSDKSHYRYCVPLFREMLLEEDVEMLLEQEFKA